MYLQEKKTKKTPITGYEANNISKNDLVPKENPVCLGEGSYGKCFLKTYKRLSIQVVEKQISGVDIPDLLKEVQIMQTLVHPNIPTVLGVQLENKPYSIIMEYVGETGSSLTVNKLLQSVHKLGEKEWLKISYNVADALHHMHKKGFLHCDLKGNNIVVSNHRGYLIDFGKACSVTAPPSKKYTSFYPHIAPEVLSGSPCSKQSDIFSLGTVLSKVGRSQHINVILKIGKECLNNSPYSRPTLVGILSSLATQT
jgi:serine/threonine-protein kinase